MNAVSKTRLRLWQWTKDLLLLAAILLVVIYPSPAYKAALRGMELFSFYRSARTDPVPDPLPHLFKD